MVNFLAAMSSSRSDVVTQFVRPSVRVFVPFFSFSVIEVSPSPKSFNVISSVFEVSRKFQGCFKKVFPLFGVSVGQTRFLSKKQLVNNVRPGREKYWIRVNFILEFLWGAKDNFNNAT